MNSNNNQQNSGNEAQNSLVRVSQTLELTDLLDLLHGKYIALRVPNYYPAQQAQEISEKLIEEKTLERYNRAPDVGVQRTAVTFFETSCCVEMLERYYEHAQVSIQGLRQACFPNLSPLDKFKLELEEMWVTGAYIENIHDQKMLAGIGRVFEDDFELPPHQDIFSRDISDAGVPPTRAFENLTAQLSANIYLRIPESGGELEIWEIKPSTFKQEEIRDQEYTYEGIIDRNILPNPTLQIKPEAGELILFDSGRVHAVRPCQGGPRVSMSMFIGYRTTDKPLTYWS